MRALKKPQITRFRKRTNKKDTRAIGSWWGLGQRHKYSYVNLLAALKLDTGYWLLVTSNSFLPMPECGYGKIFDASVGEDLAAGIEGCSGGKDVIEDDITAVRAKQRFFT